MYHIKDIFLEEGNPYIFFSGNLSTGIDPAINFDLKMYNEKYLYLKFNGKMKEGFHRKGKTYQQDVFPWYIQGRLKLLDVIAMKSHNTCAS